MNFIELVKEFQSLGCKDEGKCAIAARVYADLKDVVGIKNLTKFYDEAFDVILLRGEDEEGPNVYLPWSKSDNIDFLNIEQMQNKFGNEGVKSLTACICDPSSTILYYKMTQGWQEL